MASTTAPFVNMFDPSFQADSEEVAEARETHWYATTPGPPLILRYEEARDVLRDRRFIHGAAGYMEAHGVTEGATYDWWNGTLMSLGANPPDHKRVRDSVQRAFTPRRVEDLRSRSTALAERIIDEHLPPGEPCDFTAFTRRYPAMIMCELLGVPEGDFDVFSKGASDIGLAFSRQITPEQVPRIDAAVEELGTYVTGLIDRLRTEPGDDLLSALIQHTDIGDDERHNLAVLLVWGGQDTTHCQLGRAIVTFSQHPDQWELLAKSPDLAAQAVDEVVRWSPQARIGWRIATEPVTIHEMDVPPQSMVFINLAGANRDPRAFDHADRFDITVPHRSTHLGFSYGMHYCLGAALARMEMAEALQVLAGRFRAPEIAGDIEWRAPQASIHGPEKLPITLTPR